MPLRPGFDVERFNHFGKDYLPGLVGLVLTEVSEGLVRGELGLRKALLAPNGYLHAGAVVTFADTLAGYGCIAHLPGNAQNFTTVELKVNFLNTATQGALVRRGARRAPGADHAGLGRLGDPRRRPPQARPFPLHPAGYLSEVERAVSRGEAGGAALDRSCARPCRQGRKSAS